MTGNSAYVLDANVFIEAARRYYAFDIVPQFWVSLVDLAMAGSVVSIDRVQTELQRGKDTLAQWATTDFATGFASTNDPDVKREYANMIEWVMGQNQFKDAAKAKFARDADGWLVAYARANNYVVVTHEELAPDVRNKVPIPNVCHAFDVQYIDTFAMLRALRVTLA